MTVRRYGFTVTETEDALDLAADDVLVDGKEDPVGVGTVISDLLSILESILACNGFPITAMAISDIFTVATQEAKRNQSIQN